MTYQKFGLSLTTAIVLIIFSLISLHAPLEVYFGSIFPSQDLLIKSWKEILMVLASLVFLPVAIKTGLAKQLLRDRLFQLIAVFALAHLAVISIFYQGAGATLAGLVIDLRFFLFFTLVYGLVSLKPDLRKTIITISFVAASLVIVFGFLQITVLPRDILAHIGYSKETIAPFLTVDKNPDFTRINSTLRGPNPLGLFVSTFFTLGLSFLIRRKHSSRFVRYAKLAGQLAVFFYPRLRKLLGPIIKRPKDEPINPTIVLLALFGLGVFVLYATYSRSALIALIVSLVGVVSIRFYKNIRHFWLAGSIGLVIITGLVLAFKNTPTIQQIIFHNDPAETNTLNSDQAHASSLASAGKMFIKQPLGSGVGSTGSASLLGQKPTIIENQYLFVAHESGWLGAGLFIAIFGLVLKRLFVRRGDYLCLGLFASGLGLAVAGLVLPVFADDTISILWWGLVAVALAVPHRKF